MNKTEKINTVLGAFQKAKEENPDDYYTKLFITTDNGLIDLDFDELVKIIESIAKSGLIEINHLPNIVDLATTNKPHNGVFPMNYFSLHLEKRFDDWAKNYGVPLFLLSKIPKNKKYKADRKIAKLLVNHEKVSNFTLAQSFINVQGNDLKKRKIKKKEYLKNQKQYNQQIENRLKTLRKLFEPHGFLISFNQKETKLLHNLTK